MNKVRKWYEWTGDEVEEFLAHYNAVGLGELADKVIEIATRERPKIERRYLNPVEMMQWLADHGYEYCGQGTWRLGDRSRLCVVFEGDMWKYCGLPVGGNTFMWRPEWIKEVEV